VVVGLGLAAVPARAQNLTCNTTVSSGSFVTVTVPAGGDCVLNPGVSVTANVLVGSGANLTIGGATVNGSVIANGAHAVIIIEGTTIVTNISSANTTFETIITASTIGGSVAVNGKNSGEVAVSQNSIGENLSVSNTTAPAALVIISGNTIGGNFNCAGNSATPTNGGHPNQVGGNNRCGGI
jgi:hypothetical protein